MLNKIAQLFETRKLMALMVTGGFVGGFLMGKIQPEQFIVVVSAVTSFYFAFKAGKSEE